MIRAIDKSSIQKICSGQVVVDLATAVKEMVENALDSGATSVEVKLRDMGASYIEVSDNGSGIDPSNYDGIARKHFTSKLKDFEDIFSVSSFGFRGEALNALSELSGSFAITTKQAHQPVGANLQFDRNGGLLSQSVAARTNGTSVMVENLFDKLPVRRKDFVKSIKKHFQKMVRVVQSYALISVGVKIIVTNTTTSLTATTGPGGSAVGSRQTVFATQSGGKLTDNVSILFGAKFASSLLPIDFSVRLGKAAHSSTRDTDVAEDAENAENEYAPANIEFEGFAAEEKRVESTAAPGSDTPTPVLQDTEEGEDTTPQDKPSSPVGSASSQQGKLCTVRGLVSKVGLGVGRSDNDRQFTFCNGRPVDLPRFAKALNEIWRKYEMKQKPAFVLDISVPAGYFDVNLTPDKREVLIVQESVILEQLREVVDALYAPVRQTMPLNQGMSGGASAANWAGLFSSQASPGEDLSQAAPLARNLIQSALADYLVSPAPSTMPLTTASPSSQIESGLQFVSQDSGFAATQHSTAGEAEIKGNGLSSILATPTSSSSTLNQDGLELTSTPSASQALTQTQAHKREAVVWMSDLERDRLSASPAKRARTNPEGISFSPTATPSRAPVLSPSQLSMPSQEALLATPLLDEGVFTAADTDADASQTQLMDVEETGETDSSNAQTQVPTQSESQEHVLEEVEFVAKTKVWAFDPTAALSKYKQRNALKRAPVAVVSPAPTNTSQKDEVSPQDSQEDVFQISDGTLAASDGGAAPVVAGSQRADRQQARILHKKDFPRMRILGQFNLGFVIAELDGDLYILDQHACDEKYRFELLQRTTQIHQQPLIHPLSVETSAALELVMADNLDTFTRNGFKLTVDLAAPTGSRVKLHSVPFSKSVRFGVDDVNELASMISEHHRGGDNEGGDAISQRTSKTYLMLKNDSVTQSTQASSTSSATSSSSGEESSSVSDPKVNETRHPTDTFRLPKLVAMYASRACRSAIMIGTALHERDMQRVVSRLEHVEQPWNCPHGRPTLRHLVDLTPLREHSSHQADPRHY